MRVHQVHPKRVVVSFFRFPHGLCAILAGRNRVWGGDAYVERGALVHRRCRCKDISRAGARGTSRAGARGTSDEAAKDLWLGCSISQPRVIKENVTHFVVAPGSGPTGTAQSVVRLGAQESTASRPAGDGFIRMIGSQARSGFGPGEPRCTTFLGKMEVD